MERQGITVSKFEVKDTNRQKDREADKSYLNKEPIVENILLHRQAERRIEKV